MIIRRLSPSDAAAYRRIHLSGLRKDPAAFGSSYGEQVKRPIKAFETLLEHTRGKWAFGAFDGHRLVGVVRLVRDERKKERHKGEIVGMFVETDFRRKGIGRALLRRAIETAQQLQGIKRVRLAVVASNRSALSLYK